MEHKARQAWKDWNRCMEDAWEETFTPLLASMVMMKLRMINESEVMKR